MEALPDDSVFSHQWHQLGVKVICFWLKKCRTKRKVNSRAAGAPPPPQQENICTDSPGKRCRQQKELMSDCYQRPAVLKTSSGSSMRVQMSFHRSSSEDNLPGHRLLPWPLTFWTFLPSAQRICEAQPEGPLMVATELLRTLLASLTGREGCNLIYHSWSQSRCRNKKWADFQFNITKRGKSEGISLVLMQHFKLK